MTRLPTASPRLVVGLGNPGAEYAQTRHNAGFWFCERLAKLLGIALVPESRFHGLVGRAGELRLLLPTTYMNRSGLAVGTLARFFRIEPEAILVVHDELDLAPGDVRLKFGGSHAGHNGLKDIQAALGTDRFWRLRLGIGHPGQRDAVIHYVLKPPRAEERQAIEEAIERALAAWPDIAAGQWERAMGRINAKPKPPKSGPTDKERSS